MRTPPRWPRVLRGPAPDSLCSGATTPGSVADRVRLSRHAGVTAPAGSWNEAPCAHSDERCPARAQSRVSSLLSMQFQNRGSLTLTQHVLLPFLALLLAGFLLPDDGVLAGRDRAGGAVARSAHHPSARIRRPPSLAGGWPAGRWPRSSPDRATVPGGRRPLLVGARLPAAPSKTTAAVREGVAGSGAAPLAKRHTTAQLAGS